MMGIASNDQLNLRYYKEFANFIVKQYLICKIIDFHF